MYHWLKETDSDTMYVISDDSYVVYEIVDGKPQKAKMKSYQLSKFKPYLDLVKSTESFDVEK